MCNNKKNILKCASLIIMKASELRPHLGYCLLGCQCLMKNWHQIVQAKAIRARQLADTSAGAWDGCPIVNSWALGWSTASGPGPATSEVNEGQCVTCIIYYYYLLVHHYYILLLELLLLIITVCYYTVITLLLHIITSFIITYYYNFCYYTVITSLLRIITYSLLPIITTSLLRTITSLLHHHYIIITSLLLHYSQLQKQVIMSSLLHIMHYPCFHYYPLIW